MTKEKRDKCIKVGAIFTFCASKFKIIAINSPRNVQCQNLTRKSVVNFCFDGGDDEYEFKRKPFSL